jgi:hypothetical protein
VTKQYKIVVSTVQIIACWLVIWWVGNMLIERGRQEGIRQASEMARNAVLLLDKGYMHP